MFTCLLNINQSINIEKCFALWQQKTLRPTARMLRYLSVHPLSFFFYIF